MSPDDILRVLLEGVGHAAQDRADQLERRLDRIRKYVVSRLPELSGPHASLMEVTTNDPAIAEMILEAGVSAIERQWDMPPIGDPE